MSSESLNVIALISGGKDSFFNLLHCIHHGHRIVALANLFPANESNSTRDGVQFIDPTQQPPTGTPVDGDEKDLNSFMYQTVGHEIIPLYAAATGLPLYRQPIRGVAVHHERDYAYETREQDPSSQNEETESMIPLLEFIKARHPEANAICSGAILSTYQRTRVESIALRLGLAPLAYLWKYPILPPPANAVADETQLLMDMATAGLEARIIKVASAGLDEHHLWEQVSSSVGVDRIKSALRKFGAAEGAALGEGGEFETIVLNGPAPLFKKSITVPEDQRVVIREGGGSNWLMLRGAQVQEKSPESNSEPSIRVPDLLDSKFRLILDNIVDPESAQSGNQAIREPEASALINKNSNALDEDAEILRWSVLASSSDRASIEAETRSVVDKIRGLLSSASLDAAQITTTLVIIRNMSDFPKVNVEYGRLFAKPNPPSRITISCGDLLPDGYNIMVHATVPNSGVKSGRDGLHVQSRSYWAPANIGPYSQAINVAVTAQQEPTGVRSIYIAGQIPLIPASMMLPAPSEASHQLQITLSLQHLWRIGLEMKIQFWTSAVAYFARSSSADEMERNAKLAGLAWKLAHAQPEEEEEEDEHGPDLWDLKYNPQHMSLGGNDQQKAHVHLPDWSIFPLRQQNEPESCIPPLFAVEIEELPRQSAVEWHAHTGLSRIEESNAKLVHHSKLSVTGWRAWHVIIRCEKTNLIYSVLAQDLSDGPGETDFANVREAMALTYRDSVGRFGTEVSESAAENPYLVYVDTTSGVSPWVQSEDGGITLPYAVVPCRSIWSMNGARVGCVALYKLTIQTFSD
ncbi:Diphthine--ammonia ligase [Cladobotryum mycophilum]|uniref:Diphthine--ammonia ligase n=1 Tax=Cladobotryum mycophilum TaxID=491253 RepID=A0ABR0SDW6_9HYPO